MEPIRWGIAGTGNIASQFARGLAPLPDAQLVAVGSRTAAAAAEFAGRFDVPHQHASYEALAADPDVDIVYIGSPHTLHYEHTMLCLRGGKAVLCEKPFAINARESAAMIAEARQRNLLLMEAMWTRFLPALVRLGELLRANTIGAVRMLQADFGFRTDFNPQSRLFDPALGGGGLMDVGVYCISLASQLFGAPAQVVGLAEKGATGVDEQSAMVLQYAQGQLAVLSNAIRTNSPKQATIMGEKGMITIDAPWFVTQSLTVIRDGEQPERIDLPFDGNGYGYEAAEAMRCLRAGLLESPVVPLQETQTIMETLDHLRAQWGIRYPGDDAA